MSWLPDSKMRQDVSEVRQEQQFAMLGVRLKRTSEPVWPEDEKAEAARCGGTPVPFMKNDEADAALRDVSVNLPDRLIPISPRSSDSWAKVPELASAAAGCDYAAFRMPTSYSAPEMLVLRRLRLELTLSSDDGMMPVVIFMEPEPDVAVDVRKIGEVGVDLGKLIPSLLPQVPAAFTARIGTEVALTNVELKVQASGLLRHECSWVVADSKIAYAFIPTLVAQFSLSHTLTVSARLHVEVRKRVLGIFHKTYGKSASPMTYVYQPGQPVMPASEQVQQHSEAMLTLNRLVEERDRRNAELWNRDRNLLNPSERCREQWHSAEVGDTTEMLRRGHLAEEARDFHEMIQWYRRAADAGNTDAMLRLGQLAEEASQHHETVEMGWATAWYEQAADAGNTDAMLSMARYYRWDRRESRWWYRRAADAGNEAARARLHPWKRLIMRLRPKPG